MKIFNKILITLLAIPATIIAQETTENTAYFGEKFEANKVQMNTEAYTNLASTDSIALQLKGQITDVRLKDVG